MMVIMALCAFMCNRLFKIGKAKKVFEQGVLSYKPMFKT